MNIIKLDATDSTNSFLRGMLSEGPVKDFTTVVAETQLQGRGQRGTSWSSEPSKNLTFSVYRGFPDLPLAEQFRITMAVSLALLEGLEHFGIPDLQVKWPNDILSGSGKLAGILIENLVQGVVQQAVIGIGLNVNQLEFPGVPRAVSMLGLAGRPFDKEEVLQFLLQRLKDTLDEVHAPTLQERYEERLFRKDKPSTFRMRDGHLEMGFIRGVDQAGRLVIEFEDQVLKSFGMKELELLY